MDSDAGIFFALWRRKLTHEIGAFSVVDRGDGCAAGLFGTRLETHAGNELAPQPYALEGTEVREIRARALHRDYQLFISLPRGYTGSTRRYPVLFDTDANYAFPLIRSGGDR